VTDEPRAKVLEDGTTIGVFPVTFEGYYNVYRLWPVSDDSGFCYRHNGPHAPMEDCHHWNGGQQCDSVDFICIPGSEEVFAQARWEHLVKMDLEQIKRFFTPSRHERRQQVEVDVKTATKGKQ
jgi:hypothetical protein